MSTIVRITGWHPGLKKIQMTKLLQAYYPLSLGEAKSMTDRVLSGEMVTLTLHDSATARECAHELQVLGAIVEAPELIPGLLSDAFIVWMGQEFVRILHIPIDEEQRLQATRQFIPVFVEKVAEVYPPEQAQVLRLLHVWEHEKSIAGASIPKDKATMDWMEAIIGTLEGILAT
jgi:hypothetical protein